VSGTERHYFLRRELTMRCESDEHGRLLNVALVLMAVWPVGAVLLFGGLGLRVRRRLLKHTPDAFTQATRFLHRDVRPEMWYWAAFELAQREVLTGSVLLVPAEKSFLRVVIGLLVSLASLMCTVAIRPYLRAEDNSLATATQLALVVLFIGCNWIKLFEDVGAATTLGVARSVFGFESTDALAGLLLLFIFAMLVLMLLAVYIAVRRDARVQTIRIRGSNAHPELTLGREEVYHTFNSHIWSTGQDQAATIKRQLQRLLPEVRVFLDVDDLTDIGMLETYVEQARSMMLLLTLGYFRSRNCLREVKATIEQGKPFLLVHEADASHGGAPLQVLMDELQDIAQRAALFESNHEVIEWLRIAAFQVVSLKKISHQVLAATPVYMHESFSLVVPGALVEQNLMFPRRVVLYASANNPNAREVAEEMVAQFAGLSVCAGGERLQSVVRSGRPKLSRKLTARLQQNIARRSSQDRGSEAAEPHEAAEATSSSATGVEVMGPQLVGAPPTPEPTHFLLYLNKRTFLEGAGTALADEVRAALAAGLPIAMIHEKDEAHTERHGCAFDTFFKTTPQDLLDRNLYKALATAFEGDPEQREVSRMVFAESIGAVKSTAALRMRLTRGKLNEYLSRRSSERSKRLSIASRLRGRSSDRSGRV